jgi:hypothetical protein
MKHVVRKVIEEGIGFGMFEWVFIQVFKDNIGFSTLHAWIIGFIVFAIYLILGVIFKEDLIDPMFDS